MSSSLRPPDDYETDYFLARDGTRIARHSIGAGPPVIFANGLGATFRGFLHLYRHLAGRCRVVSWDYRCTHGSARPVDPSRIRLLHSVDDLEDLLDHEGITRAVFLGWSMGAQVNFELCRRRPQAVAAVGVIDGTAGGIFDAVNRRLPTRVAAAAFRGGLRRFGGAVGRAARLATRTPHFLALMKAARFVNPALDEKVFYELCVDYAHLDFPRYIRMLDDAHEHSAWDVLPTLRVPCTVVVGDRDFMTSLAAARRISAAIPACELVVLRGCTHYAAVEDPGGVNAAVDSLLHRAAWA